MGKVVGIDLGTTYSAIAYMNNFGRAEIIPNNVGERITPSVILFDESTPIVGSIAKRSAISDPLNVVANVKRQMGNPTWKFYTEDGETYAAEEISAIILKRLKEDAEMALGEAVTDAVITVPAYFDDPPRKATYDAGRIAGLNVLRVINEPTAAALSYSFEKLKNQETVLVYDLGGGTFDVTIMQASHDEIKVIATGGDRNLGGFDWDNEVMHFLNEEFKKQGGPDLFEEPVLEQDLRDKAEIAKKTLSTKSKTNIFFSGGGKNITVNFSLEQLEELTMPLFNRTISIMEFVLEDSKLTWSDIDKILLVGGSTRMKAIPSLIEKVSGKRPSMEVNPDEVVAMGAALQASIIQREQGAGDLVELQSFPLVEIKDVNAHSLGVIATDEKSNKEYNSIILEKNTTIPCKVGNTYSTLANNQTEIRVQVTQGEGEDLDGGMNIISDQIVQIPPYPRGAPVDVFFEYDSSGIIQVTIIDLTANDVLLNFTLDRIHNQNENVIQAMSEKMSHLTVN
jgi:molecular chaperone DnaK